MIGMSFLPWLWLVILAAGISLILYYVFKLRLLGGYWSQLIIGWIGAWLGSPVFGHWFGPLKSTWSGGEKAYYFIPAALGSIALIWLVRAAEIACSKLSEKKEKTVEIEKPTETATQE